MRIPTMRGSSVRERPGQAGALAAILVEGLGEELVAGITTRARNFRLSRRGVDADVDRAFGELEVFAESFGGWARVTQVHGGRVLSATAATARADGVTLGQADGLVATRPETLLTVTVADCVPVYLAWPGGHGLLHAGWRGVAAGVLEAGLAAAGAPLPDVGVHLGPAIGACCYEVGPEVVAALWRGRGGPERGVSEGALRPGREDRWLLDLRAALAARAAAAGVGRERISLSGSCTACDGRFHSFRSSGRAPEHGVMLAFIGRPLGPSGG